LSNGGADLPHPLGEIIGGICPRVAHGETLAMVYPSFLKYKQNSAQEKFEQIATYLGLQKQPDALRYAILELLKVTELSKATERAQFTAQEKNEIQAHPLLEKLNPKNPKAIYSMIEESITM
jgi:alcohol dehydrogenase class IV